jgi:hypothetical protein
MAVSLSGKGRMSAVEWGETGRPFWQFFLFLSGGIGKIYCLGGMAASLPGGVAVWQWRGGVSARREWMSAVEWGKQGKFLVFFFFFFFLFLSSGRGEI